MTGLPAFRRAVLAGWLAFAAPALAIGERPPPLSALYVRARAAEVAGDSQIANGDFAELLTRDPGSKLFAERGYRAALTAGDMSLALRAARLLQKADTMPPDAQLLIVADAIRARDWTAARRETDLLGRQRLFAFMAPMLRAWIAFGARDADPLAALDGARAFSLAQPYVPEQRALLLIAGGRTEDGITALRSADRSDIAAWPVRTRLIAADALARTGQRQRAAGLLDGDDPALVAARAIIEKGGSLPAPIDEAASGVGNLLVRVATDLGRQQLAPVGLALARDATFLAPRDAGAWLTCGNLLGALKQPRLAIAALDRVPADDPFASSARTLRVALLNDMGDDQAALADAVKGAQTVGDVTAWSRLGDLYLAQAKATDAARAYGKAIEVANAAKLQAAQLWPLYLQLGGAYDQADDWSAAKAALERARTLAPDQPLVLNQLGYSLIAHRDEIDRGSAMIAKASALRPDDPAITDSLGWSRYLLGDVAGAVPVLERASAADPSEPTINEHLGDAYWAAGREYEARYAWRAALVTAEDKDRARLSSKIDLGYTKATAAP